MSGPREERRGGRATAISIIAFGTRHASAFPDSVLRHAPSIAANQPSSTGLSGTTAAQMGTGHSFLGQLLCVAEMGLAPVLARVDGFLHSLEV